MTDRPSAQEDELLDDVDELLHRQVHPSFMQKGRVSSQAFRPTPKDENQLSISRGSMTTAEEAYTEEKELESVGVWSVTVGECQTVELKAFHQPVNEPIPDPAHGFIDFRGVGNKPKEKKTKRLAAMARARGCQYVPPPEEG